MNNNITTDLSYNICDLSNNTYVTNPKDNTQNEKKIWENILNNIHFHEIKFKVMPIDEKGNKKK